MLRCTAWIPSVMSSFVTLVDLYNRGCVSFKHVVFFQMKEYCGIPRTDARSVACQQYDAFFKFVDASPEHVFFLNGLTAEYQEECTLFEKAIQHYGGIRLVCTEVDSEGAIGGNAPGSSLDSRTRLKTCSNSVVNNRYCSRNDRDSDDEAAPAFALTRVLTMGIGTIMEAKEIIALFIGYHSARSLHHAVEMSVSNMLPATILQSHEHVCIVAERRSISSLHYCNVEYFVGLCDNYNAVNNVDDTPLYMCGSWCVG